MPHMDIRTSTTPKKLLNNMIVKRFSIKAILYRGFYRMLPPHIHPRRALEHP